MVSVVSGAFGAFGKLRPESRPENPGLFGTFGICSEALGLEQSDIRSVRVRNLRGVWSLWGWGLGSIPGRCPEHWQSHGSRPSGHEEQGMNTDIRLAVGFWQHPKTRKTIRRLGLEGIRSLQVLWT